jgi:hypothetical protein
VCHRDRLEPRVHAQVLEQATDVVPDGLDAEVQLVGDLLRRPAPLEQREHLGLPRGEMELRVLVRPSTTSETWPKTPMRWSPRKTGTELISTVACRPSFVTTSTTASVTSAAPITFRAKSSLARRGSSVATIDVNCAPRTSPTTFRAAAFSQRTTPLVSMW